MSATKASVFISHASDDKELVSAFVDLLRTGLNFKAKDILCTSLPGHGLKSGENVADALRTGLQKAKVMIALITPRYYESYYCMCELGGAWVISGTFIPVVVPPIGYDDLKAILGSLHCREITSKSGLDEVHHEVVNVVKEADAGTPTWNAKKDAFLKQLPDLLKKVKGPANVPMETHKELLEKLQEYEKDFAQLDEDHTKLKAYVDELEDCKDAEQVAEIEGKHFPATDEDRIEGALDHFQTLTRSVHSEGHSLPKVVIECLFYHHRGEAYRPKEYEWDAVERAQENGLVHIDGSVVHPNDEHGKIERFIDAINELRDWLEDKIPPEAFDKLQSEQDEPLDTRSRPFWDNHLDVM